MAGSADPESALHEAPGPAAPAPASPSAAGSDLPAPVAARSPPRPYWLRQRLVDFALLMRLDRPIGIWLLLWPTLWALWCASGGHPQRRLLLIFTLGTVLMRSAGCVINDLMDRDID